MSRPEPRPALQRSGDGSVHPAAPRVVAEQHVHPVPHAPAAAIRHPKRPKGVKPIDRAENIAGRATKSAPAPTFDGKPVTLNVEVPKDLRRQMRKAADKAGNTLDAVVTEALADYVARARQS